MRFKRAFGLLLPVTLILASSGCATLQESMGDILDTDSGDGELTESVVIDGIKEALRIGTGNTVISTSKVDGYLGNEMIRIALPEQLESMASTMKIAGLGLSRVYGQAADAYNNLPFTGTSRLIDLDEYVTDKALDGLFTILATEEQKIREDPAARTTELLRNVFGG